MSPEGRGSADDDAHARGLEELLAILSAQGPGVADYRLAAVRRGVAARMALRTVVSMDEYLAIVHEDPEEAGHLLDTLFVRHTRFFRDVEVYQALEEQVLPQLSRAPTRVWAIGVATGEETYSAAMLLASDPHTARRGFEVLGSDADPRGLDVARRGSYGLQSLEDVPERFRRFVVRSTKTFEVAEAIRRRVVFVEHDLRSPQLAPKEAILATFDIVLCRNLLTYFEDRYRALVLSRLAAVVRPGGALVLGQLEAFLAPDEQDFETFPGTAPGLRILRRRGPSGATRGARGVDAP